MNSFAASFGRLACVNVPAIRGPFQRANKTAWRLRCAALFMLLLALGCIRSAANTADFNNNGQPDLLFMNKTTRKLEVWFDNSFMTTSVISQPITYLGSPWTVPAGWRLVGVGRFNSAQNQLGLLFQQEAQTTRAMAVFFLSTTYPLDVSYGLALPNASPYWQARAVGDFDGDGKSDIAFQYDFGGDGAIWLMDGLNIKPGGIASFGNHPDWRITGAGDFGNWQSRTTGAKDTKDDILLTFYNPATDSIGLNLAGIWFMNGLTVDGAITLQNSSFANLVVNSPDWRLQGTGDYNSDGKADAFMRDAVIGRHPIWYLSGHIFQSGDYLKPKPDPAWKLFSQDWLQSTWRHRDVYPSISASATVNGGSATVTLSYRIKPTILNGITVKRREVGGSWTTLSSGVTETSATDSIPNPGTRYEYEVARNGGFLDAFYYARIFVCADQPISTMENRGKVLVIVDGEVYSGISAALNAFTKDLIGDGWTVVTKTDAPRHNDDSVACQTVLKSDPAADMINNNLQQGITTGRGLVKQFIDQHPDAKGIILIGHVTIPYSGNAFSDGHADHKGAWVTDAWYGHSGNGWTDVENLQTCAAAPFNSNVAGDGKFDQDFIPNPSQYTKWVGRIDFARLPQLGTGNSVTSAETDLLNAYLAKNHAYRTKDIQFDGKSAVFSTLQLIPNTPVHAYADRIPYLNAFRNMSPLFGSSFDKIHAGDPLHQRTDSYLWGFYDGSSGPAEIAQGQPGGSTLEGAFLMHTTQELAAIAANPTSHPPAKVGFYFLFGSYFGDWNYENDIMRAVLATPASGLASVWHAVWQFHGLALGDPIGEGLRKTISDDPLGSPVQRYRSLLGDPTLRMQVIAPPHTVSYDGSTLSWQAGEPGCQYYVYEAANLQSAFTRVWGPFPSTSATVSNPGVLMVRAVKPVTTGSATFNNLSQGAFYP